MQGARSRLYIENELIGPCQFADDAIRVESHRSPVLRFVSFETVRRLLPSDRDIVNTFEEEYRSVYLSPVQT